MGKNSINSITDPSAMSDSKPTLEEALFDMAVEKLSAAERAAFLDGVCGDNAALRSRLEDLLEGHFRGEGFLTRPPEARRSTRSGKSAGKGPTT